MENKPLIGASAIVIGAEIVNPFILIITINSPRQNWMKAYLCCLSVTYCHNVSGISWFSDVIVLFALMIAK